MNTSDKSDRELLELAAKAAGINAVSRCSFGDSDVVEECKLGLWNRDDGGIWNPLRNDGDALRLAVKLGMDVVVMRDAVSAGWREGDGPAPTTDSKGPWYWKEWGRNHPDHCATARRAIVCAAAAIGAAQ